MNIRIGLVVLFFWVIGGSVLKAQPGSIDGTPIVIENLLVDAAREKLLGNLEEAFRIYEEILEKDLENPTASYELARLYAGQEDFEQALEYAQQAIAGDAENPWFRIFLADLYQQTGQFTDGAQIYRELRKANPQKHDYYYKEAFFLVRADQLKEAQDVYQELEARIGVSEELIRRRHALYLGMGDQKRAAKELEKLTEAYPDNVDYWHLLADFYRKIGKQKEAQAAYNRILTIDPDDGRAQLGVAGGSVERADDVAYLNAMRSIFENPGTDIDLKIGRLMPILEKISESGNQRLADAALELASILEDVHPGQAKSFAAGGDILYLSQRPRGAADKYRRALELDDTNFLLWENYFAALKNTGQWAILVQQSEEATFLFPNQALVYYLNGYGLQAMGDYEEALSILNEALFMSGENTVLQQAIISTIGLTYEGMEEPTEASEAFAKAIEIDPINPLPLARFALALAKRGDERALELVEQATDKGADDPEILHAIGRTYYLTGALKKAKKWLEKALAETGAQHPLYLEHLGDLRFREGDSEAALRYWNQAQDLGRDTDLLRKKIADKMLYE